MANKTKSKFLDSIHPAAHDFHDFGLRDGITMREFDAMCLPEPAVYTAAKIKQVRNRMKVSQPVFAVYLNVASATVKAWEQDDKKPSGPAQRLLDVVDRKGLEALV